MRVALAGGGTAGHVEPALSVAFQLLDSNVAGLESIVFLGSKTGLENSLVPANGFRLETVATFAMPRKVNLDLIKLPFRLWAARRAAVEILKSNKVEVLVGFGGYVSVPAYLAAIQLRIPFIVHEANAKPGIANKIFARFATRAVDTVPGSIKGALTLGIPIKREIKNLNREELRSKSRNELGLSSSGRVLLVFGGSQGAEQINKAISGFSDLLLENQISVIHVVGPNNLAHYQSRSHANGSRYLVMGYMSNMPVGYAASDLVLCRAGALTVAELSAIGLPAIFVPYPIGNGEQELNAAHLISVGAALLVPNHLCTASNLAEIVLPIFKDSSRLMQMSTAGRNTQKIDAAKNMVSLIQEICS